MFGRSEPNSNVVIEGCSERFHKIIRKAVVIEFFLSKVSKAADLQPETFYLQKDSSMPEIFQSILLAENLRAAA